jgi:DNA-binding response OmpR family regulator
MDTPRILIIEDEEKIARFLELELVHEGYQVGKAFDGLQGLELAESGNYNLILLDVLLPELNGIEVLRRLRRSSDIPVIMLTAKDEVSDKVSGLDTGADDYITKPFAIEELLARIRAILRKTPPAASSPTPPPSSWLEAGNLRLDTQGHKVLFNSDAIELTKREFDLLKILLENKDIVMNRETLLNKVWGYDYAGETNVVDVYIRYLRAKIDDVFSVKIIETIRGVGYVIKNQ